jgi:rod shape-determining protein MreD
MKIRFLIPVCLLVFLMETTVFTNMRILGVGFDLPLIIAVILTLIFSEKEGLTVALVCGMLRDIFFAKALGVNTLSLCLVVLITSVVSNHIHKRNPVNAMLYMVASTGVFNLLYIFFNAVSENPVRLYMFPKIFLVQSAMNGIICLFLYKFLYDKLFKRQGVM